MPASTCGRTQKLPSVSRRWPGPVAFKPFSSPIKAVLKHCRLIFFGFALDKQNKYTEAENAYVAATKLKGSDPQAWQGLIQLYEKVGASKLSQYQPAALNLAEIYQNLDDKYRCQDVVDK